MHCPLNNGIRRASTHHIKNAMNRFIAFNAEQGRAKNFFGRGIDQNTAARGVGSPGKHPMGKTPAMRCAPR